MVVNGRTEKRVDAAIREIRQTHTQAELLGVAADVSNAVGCEKLTQPALAAEILVNNMSIFEPTPWRKFPTKTGRAFSRRTSSLCLDQDCAGGPRARHCRRFGGHGTHGQQRARTPHAFRGRGSFHLESERAKRYRPFSLRAGNFQVDAPEFPAEAFRDYRRSSKHGRVPVEPVCLRNHRRPSRRRRRRPPHPATRRAPAKVDSSLYGKPCLAFPPLSPPRPMPPLHPSTQNSLRPALYSTLLRSATRPRVGRPPTTRRSAAVPFARANRRARALCLLR